MSAEGRLRALEDREQIRDLVHRYARCVWDDDARAAVSLFAEDGEMDTGDRPPIRGREALLAAYEQMLGSMTLLPFVTNLVVDALEGDRAAGTCHLDLRATVAGRAMIGAGRYDDRYVRVDGTWRFQSRRLVMRFLVPLAEGWRE